MEIAKPIFIIVASLTLFGIFGGFDPGIGIGEMFLKAVFVGLVFATAHAVKEAKAIIVEKI